jgi:hypothetical protein
MTNPFDVLEATGTFGACTCSDEEKDGPCRNPATVLTMEGWAVCQRHAELIDGLAKIISS